MQDVFGADGRQALANFALGSVLLAFDFDGTLAPIVPHPDDARPRPKTRSLLAQLKSIYPCAIISGRARMDALQRVGDLQTWAACGNHGAEVMGGTDPYEALVRQWAPVIREALVGYPGVFVEDKRFSISIHYRNTADPVAAAAAVSRLATMLPGARVMGGKMVVNVIPAGAPHKGIALDCMRRWAFCDRAVYVGDDVTDEDAFGLPAHEVLSIRVGESATSRARYFIESQERVDDLLATLVSLGLHSLCMHAQL